MHPDQGSGGGAVTTLAILFVICAAVVCVFGQNTNRKTKEGEPLLDKFESSGYEQFHHIPE